ncbi:hypothetical protein [Variovorax sp. OV329]|uniref:hypothetical protein n=1 Tax=Variovorax sp. OV329 TaxID=1882825 RepID=UPI0008DF1396|nr:hypothetical protein [Variovorax sp. OV329]SFM58315.1 hypothetical protein SAMN05444747_106325 [Variovorax sp. OV329]
MSPEKLRICGPDGAYRSGEAILVQDGALFLGTIEAPELSRDGKSVHFGRFLPSPAVRTEDRHFAPLLLLEVMAFIAEHFAAVETIRFTLTRQVEMHGDGLKVALSRLALLERIGAANLQMTPTPDASIPGNFVVQGVWEYNGPNLASLTLELAAQRLDYFRQRAELVAAQPTIAGRWRRWRWWRSTAS